MTHHYSEDADHKVRYDVNVRKPQPCFLSRTITNLASFDTEEQAIAAVGNCETHYGEELYITEENETTGNSCCVLSAEWEDDLGRYLSN